MKTSKLIDWAIIAVCLIAACGVMRAQDQTPPKQESICGIDKQQYSPNIDLLHVACVDYEALKARMPEIAFTKDGWHTQVILHVRAGTVAYVSVDGGRTYARQPITQDAWGRLVALVELPGAHWTAVDVKIVNEIE